MRASRYSPLLRRATWAASAGGVVLIAVVVPDDTVTVWRTALLATTAALFAAALVLVGLDVSRRRRAGAPSGVPDWVHLLPRQQRDELVALVADHERRLRLAEQSAAQARRRSEKSMVGMWDVLAAAVSAEERVRGRFVADLHDSVVQTMIVCAYLAEDEDTTRADLAEHLRQAEQQLRDIMVLTRPPELARASLGHAAGHLSRTLAVRNGLAVEWTWPQGQHDLPEAVAITLYRFFQEALHNVVKHAGVREAQAGLNIGEDVVAWVHDDGAGFDPQARRVSSAGHHVGLELMADRAQQVGASAQVHSAPGEGTTVTLRLRLPQASPDRPVSVGELGPSAPQLLRSPGAAQE